MDMCYIPGITAQMCGSKSIHYVSKLTDTIHYVSKLTDTSKKTESLPTAVHSLAATSSQIPIF